MLTTSPSWRGLAPIAVLAVTLLVPSNAPAASYRFKVDLTVHQKTGWEETVRHPAPGDGYCRDDVHWTYYSEGGGELRAKVVGARVTFKGTRRALQSTEIKVPAKQLSDAKPYTVAQVGIAEEGCDLPSPPALSVGECNPFAPRRGTARSFLLVLRGRMTLTGGFYSRYNAACADPSLYTGVLGFGGRPARRDVNDLIVSRRVRSIELDASDTTKFTCKNLSDFGANSQCIEGSGRGTASWHVKLTRIY